MNCGFFFPRTSGRFAELLEGRDALEKIRGAANKVLGKPVRVCAKIESIAAAAAAGAPGISQSQAVRQVCGSMVRRSGVAGAL